MSHKERPAGPPHMFTIGGYFIRETCIIQHNLVINSSFVKLIMFSFCLRCVREVLVVHFVQQTHRYTMGAEY